MSDTGRPSGSDGTAKRVIVIDDSEIVLESIKDALMDVGCDVVTMTEPSRSTFVGEQPADLILLDVNMPQAFGDDIARFLRDAWGMPSPIYLYSSLTAEELEERARDAGADGYICKSWGKERLVERVREILGLEAPEGGPAAESEGGAADGSSDSGGDLADRREHAQTVYHRFARRCHDRNGDINGTLDALATADEESAARAVHGIALHLHDFVGEAKLLGLDRVAAAASSLKGLLESWDTELTQEAHRERFRESLTRLTSLSERCAHDSPDAELLRELNSLRSELDSELGIELSAEPAPPAADAEEPAQLLRILVFDDSPIVGEVLSLELEARGHDVALAATLAEFNKSLIEFAPELIFLDVNMPEISGTELCQHLRQHHLTQKLPIIFLSSLPDGELAKLAKKWGADGYLSKQRGMEELIKYLDELLVEIIF